MGQKSSSKDESDMLSVNEVAVKLRISRWTVHRLLREGRLGSVKIGSRRLVPRRSLEEFEKHLENGKGE